MANVIQNIPVSVEGPESITVTLLREDTIAVSNVFRTAFEIAMALFSTMLGAIISMCSPSNTPNTKPTPIPTIYWIVLGVSFFAMAAFLYLTAKYKKQATQGR